MQVQNPDDLAYATYTQKGALGPRWGKRVLAGVPRRGDPTAAERVASLQTGVQPPRTFSAVLYYPAVRRTPHLPPSLPAPPAVCSLTV